MATDTTPQNLIAPPFTTPLTDIGSSNTLSRTYWLFLKDVGVALGGASVTGIVQYGTHAARLDFATDGLTSGALWIETDTGLIYQWRVSAWAFVAGTQVIDQKLTAASTTIDPPKTGAVDLVVILRQPVAGNCAIVWGTGFSATSKAIDMTGSTISTFRFVRSGGIYVQIGQPSTGMQP